MDTHDLAYVAGFFDGEGNIDIAHNHGNGNGKREQYTLSIKVTQKEPHALEPLLEFGGSFYNPRPGYYQWHIHGAKAAKFLELILPYLRAKTGQAEAALRFQAVIGQVLPLPPQVVQMQQVKFLNLLAGEDIVFPKRQNPLLVQEQLYRKFRSIK